METKIQTRLILAPLTGHPKRGCLLLFKICTKTLYRQLSPWVSSLETHLTFRYRPVGAADAICCEAPMCTVGKQSPPRSCRLGLVQNHHLGDPTAQTLSFFSF